MPTIEQTMSRIRKEALDELLRSQAADGIVDFLLESQADLDYRLCLVELGIN